MRFPSPIRVCLVAVVCGLGIAPGGLGLADEIPGGGPGGEASSVVVDLLTPPGGEVEGTVVVRALDGGMLLEEATGRLRVIEPTAIAGMRVLPSAVGPPSAEAMGRLVLEELPEGFELLHTRHYCICYDTSRDYARWTAAVFERLHDAFHNYWRRAGIEVSEPKRPLVVVIFSDRGRYLEHARERMGPAASEVVGFYDMLSNRVTTFDLTGSDAVRRAVGARGPTAGPQILASPAASAFVATLVHEATHQLAFNSGLQRRLAPIPLWVSEGIAMYFETPDLRSQRGWNAIGRVNRPRIQRWRQRQAAGDDGLAARIVVDDDPLRDPATALDAYAEAWALTHFLLTTRRAAFVDYLQTLAAKEPLAEDSARTRLDDFRAAFGEEPAGLKEELARFLARQRP